MMERAERVCCVFFGLGVGRSFLRRISTDQLFPARFFLPSYARLLFDGGSLERTS